MDDEQAVRDLRFILWALSPEKYAKHHADQVLENLHAAPPKEEEEVCQ
jgi:hypothetical protein